MDIPNILAVVLTGFTVLFVLGLVLFRLLWAGSSLAGFGTLPRSLTKLRRWLHGEEKSDRVRLLVTLAVALFLVVFLLRVGAYYPPIAR